MTSYLENKLKILNASKKKLDEEKSNIEKQKRDIEKQIKLEIEKQQKLSKNGTIIKMETQIEELKKRLQGKIMPNNLQILEKKYQKDYKEGCDELIRKRNSYEMTDEEVRVESIILREKYEDIRKKIKQLEGTNSTNRTRGRIYDYLGDKTKNITLEEFKRNLSEISEATKYKYLNSFSEFTINEFALNKILYQINPEIKVYDTILPIFSTMLDIMKKQQEEIDLLKN